MADLQVVYRSTHPDAIAAWHAAQDGHHAAQEARKALLAELGFDGRRVLIRNSIVVGIQHLPEHGYRPQGWRWHPKTDHVIVPDRRSAAGKATWARLTSRDLSTPSVRTMLPGGMPAWAFDVEASRRYQPSVELLGGALYVAWPCDPEALERGDKVDPGVWERIRRSAYYLAVEAEAERAEAVSADA